MLSKLEKNMEKIQKEMTHVGFYLGGLTKLKGSKKKACIEEGISLMVVRSQTHSTTF